MSNHNVTRYSIRGSTLSNSLDFNFTDLVGYKISVIGYNMWHNEQLSGPSELIIGTDSDGRGSLSCFSVNPINHCHTLLDYVNSPLGGVHDILPVCFKKTKGFVHTKSFLVITSIKFTFYLWLVTFDKSEVSWSKLRELNCKDWCLDLDQTPLFRFHIQCSSKRSSIELCVYENLKPKEALVNASLHDKEPVLLKCLTIFDLSESLNSKKIHLKDTISNNHFFITKYS